MVTFMLYGIIYIGNDAFLLPIWRFFIAQIAEMQISRDCFKHNLLK